MLSSFFFFFFFLFFWEGGGGGGERGGGEQQRKNAFFHDKISFNQNFNMFTVCMWTVWSTRQKNTQKLVQET